MAEAGLKAMARTKTLKFGHFIVEFATPGIGHILKNAGCEFVLFDLEHSGFGFETVKSAHALFRGGGHRRRSCACRRRNTTTSPAPATWAPRASCCRWSATPRRRAHILDCMKYHPEGKRGVALGVAHDRLPAGAVAGQARRGQPAHHLVLPDRDRGGREERRRDRGDRRRRLPVGRAFRPVGLAGHSRPVRPSEIHQGDRHGRRAPAASTRRRSGRLVPERRDRASTSTRWGFDFICYSGDVWVLHNALAEAVDAAPRRLQEAVRRRMADKFRVALSGDFRKADGSPTFPDFDLAPLRTAPGRRGGLYRRGQPRHAPSSSPISTR